ncbi:MAG: prepilin-type N-terminal cleavage/methylation domain-containing protein, partial [Phycisphaerae bacterium]|nr:prepilin-type N-terminal cleavage/methylation domain-containing protein [Phycisphaerae bacterium]
MKKGFTLVEVVVAITLLAMMITFSGIIYSVSIDAYRIAGANAEIMQKFRAITGQLDSDLAGLRKDAPIFMWFQQEPYDSTDPNKGYVRYDQMMFFADGDFQAVNSYFEYPAGSGVYVPDPNGGGDYFVIGNTARIYYGQGRLLDHGSILNPWDLKNLLGKDGKSRDREITITRRQHILSSDINLYKFPLSSSGFIFNYNGNEYFEHDNLSLSEWDVICSDPND